MLAPDVDTYLETMRSVAIPFFESQERFRFLGRGGVGLSALHIKPDAQRRTPYSCTLVFVPGRTESFLKYAETFYDLAQLGHEIFAFDHRGQGFSERLLPDPQIGYVADFGDYRDDLQSFLATVVMERKYFSRTFIVAHSMGGALVLDTLSGAAKEQSHPGLDLFFQSLCGVAVSAPMLAIRLGFGEWLTEAVVAARCLMGKSKAYSALPGPLDPARYGNDLTHCIPRLTWYRSVLADRPQIRLGMPSNQWMLEAIRFCAALRKRLTEHPIAWPMLVITPGRDSVVDVAAQTLIRQSYSGKLLERITLPDAAHDPFLETDATRSIVLGALQQFVSLSEGLSESIS
jgi:lysophospholipase